MIETAKKDIIIQATEVKNIYIRAFNPLTNCNLHQFRLWY